MLKLTTVILFVSYIAIVSSAFLSDGVKKVQFTKAKDGSNEYDFEYDLECGRKFSGRTYRVDDPNDYIFIIFGADDILYWAKFTKDEFKSVNSTTKVVRLVERSPNRIYFKDDFSGYELIFSKDIMFVTPYQTAWDLEQICFTRNNNANETFKYIISGTNNSRKYYGITYYESNNPHVQRIHLDDGYQRNDVYEVEFTNDELKSEQTFCKGISKTISQGGVLGAYPVNNINPNLLKSLAG